MAAIAQLVEHSFVWELPSSSWSTHTYCCNESLVSLVRFQLAAPIINIGQEGLTT